MLSMKRPHDLVAFMHQEERVNDVEELKSYIIKHQDVVDSTDEKDDGKLIMTLHRHRGSQSETAEFYLLKSTFYLSVTNYSIG